MMSRLDRIKKENNDSDESFNDSGIGDGSFLLLETASMEHIHGRLTEENPSSEAVRVQVAGNDEEAAVAASPQSSSKRSEEEYTEEHVTVEPGNPDATDTLPARITDSSTYAEQGKTDNLLEMCKLLRARTVVSTPGLTDVPKTSLNREKPVLLASWNVGGFNEWTEATLKVLLDIIGVDFLCLQEIFYFIAYVDLMETYGYSYVMLPPTVDSRRGLLILFKKGLLSYVGNARGKINVNCKHRSDSHYPEGDFEHISMDIKIGQNLHRIVKYYHSPNNYKKCFTDSHGIVTDFNDYKYNAMEEKKKDATYVHFFGDLNPGKHLKTAEEKFTEKRILSCLPRITAQNAASKDGWFSQQFNNSLTAPDAVFTHWSKEPRTLKGVANNPAGIVVHKPVSHIEILETVKHNMERLSKERPDSRELVNKVDKLFTGKETLSNFHYVILAEFEVREDMTIPVHCSPVLQGKRVENNQEERKRERRLSPTKYFCSKICCKVLLRHLFNNPDVNLNDLVSE